MEILGIGPVGLSGMAARHRTAIFSGCGDAAAKAVGRNPKTETETDLVRQRSEVVKGVGRRSDVG
ncbi:MAG: hypothetical protein B7Y57_30220, partial [Rhodospirillales bacterium 35-66-84]